MVHRRLRSGAGTVVLILILCQALLFPPNAGAGVASERLIIFLQPGRSPVDSAFQTHSLLRIRELAQSMGIEVSELNAAEGAPSEVAITPLIVYQNHRGRSVYQGRTTTLDRIRNFIRTSRYVPQGQALNHREHIPVLNYGRARIWAPLKVAPVTGSPPEKYDHAAFVAEALAAIEKGFTQFRMLKKADLGRADRGFYMDFNPWLAQDGTLFLSLALYSQFHCKEPVFEQKGAALTGPWKDRRKIFQKAAAVMEDAVVQRILDPHGGDGFDPVDAAVPTVSWQALGLALPPAPEAKSAGGPVEAQIPQHWVVARPAEVDPPLVMFRFPAPLDNYAGEATRATGELSLSVDRRLDGAAGFVEVDPRSVTMGEKTLDQVIQGSMFLDSKRHPAARFVIDSVGSNGEVLAYGQLSPACFNGTLTLKGKSVPLTATMEIEPVLDDDRNPLLLVRGSFQIDLRDFDIEGADGPSPAKDTLLFDLNFVLKQKTGR